MSIKQDIPFSFKGSLTAGWYRIRISLHGRPAPWHFLLELGMPSVPDHLGRIHLPLPDNNNLIDTIIWLRQDSEYLNLVPPHNEESIINAHIDVKNIGLFHAVTAMIYTVANKAETTNPSSHFAVVAKNWARFRKKGIRGMSVNLYKDYYKTSLDKPNTTDYSYLDWINQNDRVSSIKLKSMNRRADALKSLGPVISIIMPVHNTDPEFLKQAIDSVKSQLYKNWELCIVDDHSNRRATRRILENLSSTDSRIKVKRLKANSGISRASNAALELARGTYITFLDHDDILREHSLLRVAEELYHNPQINLLYTDEDKIDTYGNRCDPHFKPDWNPEYLRSVNYICHLAVYRKSLIEKVGGLRIDHDGAQDYDLLLRITDLLCEEEIHHIPEILYHWRITEESTAANPENKRYAAEAGRQALANYLNKLNISSPVFHGEHPTTYKFNYPLPVEHPRVSIIIPTKNCHNLVKQCIDSIKELTDYDNYEIIVIDNGSTERESLNYFKSLRKGNVADVLRLDIPFNYSTLNNFGVKQASGSIVALVNNDIEVINSTWLSEMVSLAIRPDTGAVGAKLLYPDGTIQHGGVILGIGGVAGHAHKYFSSDSAGYFGRLIHRQNLSAVTAACLVVRKDVYLEVGGLDETNLTVAFNDVDFCLRLLEEGYRNVWTPHAKLYHHESLSRGNDDTREKQDRFMKEVNYMQMRWGERLAFDPAYNLNLTLEHENYTLSYPPRNK